MFISLKRNHVLVSIIFAFYIILPCSLPCIAKESQRQPHAPDPQYTYQNAEKYFLEAERNFNFERSQNLYNKAVQLLYIASNHCCDNNLLLKIEKLKIRCYDRQSNYAKKHQVFEKYYQLVSHNDLNKTAFLLKTEADYLYDDNELAEAVQLYQFILARYPNSSISPEIAYKLAKTADLTDKGQDMLWSTLPEYQKVIDKYPTSSYAEQAYLDMINLWYQNDNLNMAEQHLNEFLDRYPESKLTPAALYQLGELFLHSNNTKAASEVLGMLLASYPTDCYTGLLRTHLEN